jgi:uncharacterized protein YceK
MSFMLGREKMQIKHILLLLSTISMITGCGTCRIFNRDMSHDFVNEGVYRATRSDFGLISQTPSTGEPTMYLLVPFLLIDTPIASIVDTIYLPWDITDTEEERFMREMRYYGVIDKEKNPNEVSPLD